MLYFAYGSNMQWTRIKERCPSVNFVCRALLPDCRLVFPRYSRNNRCWTASIEKAEGLQVWGAVYKIDDRDVRNLNQQEGYRLDRTNDKNAHIPFQCHVLEEGVDDKLLAVVTFITNLEGDPPPEHRKRKAPSSEYRNRLVSGAKHWGLPENYVRQLESIETVD